MKARASRAVALTLAFLLPLCLTFSSAAYPTAPVGHVFCHGAREGARIALTFDDGPHPRYTAAILDILRQYDIRATFFEIGSNVERWPEIAARVAAEGHEIGNHTFSHACLKRMSAECLCEEIEKADEIFSRLGLPVPVLFRPPQGVLTDVLPAVLASSEKTGVLWTIDTCDWQHRPEDRIVNEALESVRSGDIILFHDYVSGENTTIPAIKKLIPALLARGYEFVTVSELLAGVDQSSAVAPSSSSSL